MPNLILAALDPMGVILAIVGLGGLIFFHELGHFVACRLTGTRVEAFSIGFGPKLIGWRRGPTDYKISLIPLGGYVKMAAENPGEARSDAPDEFPNKSFSQRLFIMSNGVIFNVILAVGLFVWAFRAGVPFLRPELGLVVHGEAAWEGGLRAGDRILEVNGKPLLSFEDLKTEVAFSAADELLRLTVERDGTRFETTVEPRYSELQGMPEIGVLPSMERAALGVDPDGPAANAGGREGDVILAVDGTPTPNMELFQRAVERAAGRVPEGTKEASVTLQVGRASGEVVELTMLLPLEQTPQLGIVPFRGNLVARVKRRGPDLLQVGDELLEVNGRPVADLGSLLDGARGEEPLVSLRVRRKEELLAPAPPYGLTVRDLADSVSAAYDMTQTRVSPRSGMPAERAGILAGDRILSVAGEATANWEAVRAAVAKSGMTPLEVVVERGGDKIPITILPGGSADWRLGYRFQTSTDIHREKSLLRAIGTGWDRTVLTIKQVVLTLRGLITARVSRKNLGGPIMIARATYDASDQGLGRYLQLLALISVNLAILNLLPIPVLDGGQIVLLCAEKLRGKPLSERVMGYFQVFGLLCILGLMFLAFYNDIAAMFR